MIASTPEPPYVAVIFTSIRSTSPAEDYVAMAQEMDELVRTQPGYLGHESAREGLGITVSYWADEPSAVGWKRVSEHLAAQRLGRSTFYDDYLVRVATVTRSYGPSRG